MSNATLRTFVALLLPDGVRTGLAAVGEELRAQTRGLTWVPPDNLHLTLRFLGEDGKGGKQSLTRTIHEGS